MASEATKIPFVEGAAPATPAANRSVIYVKSDGLFYSKDDAGTETLMSGGATATRASLGLDTTDSPQFAAINLGHASDTTIARVSAGVVSIEGTNIVKAGAVTTSGLTQATGKLLGRSSASTGAIEEITVGTNLTLSGGTLDAAGGGTAEQLALKAYAAGSDGSLASTSSSSMTDVDTTNAAVTFTAPASGNVLVKVGILHNATGGSGGNSFLGLRESTTTVASVYAAGNLGNVAVWREVTFYVSGISAGSHTYKLAHRSDAGVATSTVYTGPTFGTLTMEVRAAP